MSKKVIFDIKHLYKTFGEGKLKTAVLRGIDLQIFEGEQVAIMGQSGAGKSTLLHLAGGLEVPTEGEIALYDQPFSQLSDNHRARMRACYLGFIYQFHHLLPELTALENVAISAMIKGDNVRSAKQLALALLSAVGLKNKIHHKPSELSGGERQRVAIARALCNQPRCILADEPTGNLDQENATQVLSLLKHLHQKGFVNQEHPLSLIIVTHDPLIAEQLDRTVHIADGRIV